MSIDAERWAWDQDLGGQPTWKYVLLCLAHRQNHKTQLCCPSINTISRDTGLGKTAVKDALNGLRSLGLVSSGQSQTVNGRRTSNRYVLHLDRVLRPGMTPQASASGRRSRTTKATAQPLVPSSSRGSDDDYGCQPTGGVGRVAAMEMGRQPATNREEENREVENREVEASEPNSGAKEERPTRHSQFDGPWRGAAVALDRGGWGLGASGEPLEPEVATTLSTLDRYREAVKRKRIDDEESGRLLRIRLINRNTLSRLREVVSSSN